MKRILTLATFSYLGLASPPANAACTTGACVSAGARLASVDSSRGALMNAVLGDLLGNSINLSVADWNALARSNVNLASFLSALQTQTSTGSPSAALSASASLAQIVNAAATAAQADGNSAAASALSHLSVSALFGNVRLGDMLSVSLPNGALATSKINLLELVSGSIQLFNYNNALTTPTPITLSGSALGLGGVINSVDLYAQVIEPPVYVCAPAGAQFHTGAIRVKLNLNLVSLSPNVSALNSLAGISGASAAITQLQLYTEVARAEGTITAINAVANTVTVQATPGVADLYLGNISDSAFFNRGHVLNANADLNFATIGTLSVTQPLIGATTVNIQAKSYARGQAPFTNVLSFTGPYPQTKTAYTSAGFIANAVDSLTSNLQLELSPSLGTLDSAILPLLKTAVSGSLTPALATLLTSLVDPLLETLGIRLGEVDVTVNGLTQLCSISGYAYSDANHNSVRDNTEAGCGVALYAKLVPASGPTGPATNVTTVDPTSGAFSFPNVAGGGYSIVLDNNATASDVTPTLPTGWLGTETPTQTRALTVAAADIANQNFGLYNGSRLDGTVFKDNGAGSDTANNGVQDGTESGIIGVALKVTDATGATAHDSATTSSGGGYTLWIPAGAGAAILKVIETNAAGYVSVGASAGNTGGSYNRAHDTVSFTNVIGTVYTNVNFANVPDNSFNSDNQQTVLPGGIALYTHVFNAGSAGQLTIAATGTANPSINWNTVVYLDGNCNGVIDSGETPVSGSLNVTADQKICIVVKTFAPENAPYNAQYNQTLGASFSYANSSIVWSQSRSDLTLVGRTTDTGLTLVKSVDKAAAKSGDALTYTIRYENQSSGALHNLTIHDATPAYTVFGAAQCGTLPAGLSVCSISQQPATGAAGAVEWTFTGTLDPGAAGNVSFSVTLQ
ncbi:MAG: DUF11 domain-containing protein [Gammaproteobacteria bacterium]|nr:DUF11 domain-containing protein [Gammaproteobacteria bacterium]